MTRFYIQLVYIFIVGIFDLLVTCVLILLTVLFWDYLSELLSTVLICLLFAIVAISLTLRVNKD